jgi:hypothetical protein
MKRLFIFALLILGLIDCKLDFWNSSNGKDCALYSLQGRLQDIKYAPIQGATVRIVDLKNGVVWDTRTDYAGEFVIADLRVVPNADNLQFYVSTAGYQGYIPSPTCPECSLNFTEYEKCYYRILITINPIVQP